MSPTASAVNQPGHRTALWDSLLSAEMNVCYWTIISRKYALLDKCFKIVVAATASGGAIASLTIWQQFPWIWKGVIVASAVAALLHPYLCDSESLKRMSELVATWKEIAVEYDLLWEFDDSLHDGRSLEKYQSMKYRESKIDDTKLPNSTRIIERAYRCVLKKRGL